MSFRSFFASQSKQRRQSFGSNSSWKQLFMKNPIRNSIVSVVTISWLDMYIDRYIISDRCWNKKPGGGNDESSTTPRHLKRIQEIPRADWKQKTYNSGLTYSTLPGVTWGHVVGPWLCDYIFPTFVSQLLGYQQYYWNESASYQVSDYGMWKIESASYELHSMILEAVDEIIQSDELLEMFGIPNELWAAVRESWQNRDVDMIGRFDFLWNGNDDQPKLAEYNADTPTVLIESGKSQRNWHEETKQHLGYGQFNILDDAIIDSWKKIIIANQQEKLLVDDDYYGVVACNDDDDESSLSRTTTITLAAQGISFWNDPNVFGGTSTFPSSWSSWRRMFGYVVDSIESKYCFQEEAMTAKYMYQLAQKAVAEEQESLSSSGTSNNKSGIDGAGSKVKLELVDYDTLNATNLYGGSGGGVLWKLYPWEWLIKEKLGEEVQQSYMMMMSSNSGSSRSRRRQTFLEPPWKLVASSKAMLAYLWRKHPNHPNLLPAAMADELVAVDKTGSAKHWVSKPVLGREGVGLQYGDESGAKKLEEFSELAKNAGQVLVLPQAPPPPHPVFSYFNQASGGGPSFTDALKRAAKDAWEDSLPVQKWKAWCNGPIDKKPEEHVQLYLGPPVVQQYYDVASMHGRKVITSSWIVRGMPAGVCLLPTTIHVSFHITLSPANQLRTRRALDTNVGVHQGNFILLKINAAFDENFMVMDKSTRGNTVKRDC